MATNNSAFSIKRVTDGVVSGATLNNTILSLNRTRNLSSITVDLSPLSGETPTQLSFTNGLTETGGTVSLGGTLTGNTKISTATNSFVIGGGVATGTSSIALGNSSNAFGENSFAAGSSGQAYGYSSISIGNFSIACGGSSFATQYGTANGQTAIGMGSSTAVGDDAIGIGRSMDACAQQSIAIGGRNNCVFAFNSSILGGAYNSISSGNTFASIIGGNNIDLTGNTYASHTVVSKIAIMDSPSAGSSEDTILVRDSSTGIIRQVPQSNLGGEASVNSNDTEVIFNNGGILTGSTDFRFGTNGSSLSIGGNPSYTGLIGLNSISLQAGGTYAYGATGDSAIAIGRNTYAHGCKSISIGVYSGAYGYGSIALGGSSCGQYSVSIGNGRAYARNSIAMQGGCAFGNDSFSLGFTSRANANRSIAFGARSSVCSGATYGIAINAGYSTAPKSIAIGNFGGNASLRPRACGERSIVLANGDNQSTTAHATLSSIFGGRNNNIQSGNTRATIVGGNSINLTGNSYINHTVVGDLAIYETPSTGTSGDTILVRDSSSGIIRQINQSELTSGGGSSSLTFNNGLINNNGTVSLGGTLTGNIVINSGNDYGISIGNDGMYYSNCAGARSLALGTGNRVLNACDSFGGGANSNICNSSESFAFGFDNNIYNSRSSVSLGYNSSIDCTRSSVLFGGRNKIGDYGIGCVRNSMVTGCRVIIHSSNSFAGGQGLYSKEVFSCGFNSFNFSANDNNQTSNHGVLADYSAILGGLNHNIESGNTRAAIIGGNTIKLTGNTYINTTAVSKLAIMDSPSAGDASTTVMVRDSSTGIIQERSQADVASASDERLKTIINPISNVLDGISTLNTYEYEFNDKIKPDSLKGKTRYGLIAQELEKVFPYAVTDDYVIGDETYKSVRYNEVVPILVKAIQELKNEIDLLK